MFSSPYLRTPPMHPYHDFRPTEFIHNPEPEVDHFRQIFALQFASSEEAFDCCQRLARKCGFGVRRRTSKACTIYIVCSREGRPESKKDGVRKRNRTSERCNCDWRVVLFLTDKKVWEFRAGKCMVHNHHLISEEFRTHLENQTRHQRTASAPVFVSSNLSQMVVATPPPSPPKNALEAAQRIQTMPMFSQDVFHHMHQKSHSMGSYGHATHPRQMPATPYSQGGTQLPYPYDGRNVNSMMFPSPLLDLQPMYDPHYFPNTQHLFGLGLYQTNMISPGQKIFMHPPPVNGQQLSQQHEQTDHHELLQQTPHSMTHSQQMHHQLPRLQLQLQQIPMQSPQQEQQPETQRQEQEQPQCPQAQHMEQQEQQQLQTQYQANPQPEMQYQEQQQLPTQYQEQQQQLQQLPPLHQFYSSPVSKPDPNPLTQSPVSETLPLPLLTTEAMLMKSDL